MSTYEWEEGTFKLPTAEFSRVRKAVQTFVAQSEQAKFDHAQRFWKGLDAKAKRDPRAYGKAARVYCYGNRRPDYDYALEYPDLPASSGVGAHTPYGNPDADELYALLNKVRPREARDDGREPKVEARKARRILKSDMDVPTNRTTSFVVGDRAAYITFDRDDSTVTWEVPENNHACDHANATPLAAHFFATLEGVRWTRNTGGSVSGNDEYSRESRDVGGGANYWKFGYGPLGKSPMQMAAELYRGSSRQGRQPRGASRGGQFTGTYRGESPGYL